jgi:aminopeptidase N
MCSWTSVCNKLTWLAIFAGVFALPAYPLFSQPDFLISSCKSHQRFGQRAQPMGIHSTRGQLDIVHQYLRLSVDPADAYLRGQVTTQVRTLQDHIENITLDFKSNMQTKTVLVNQYPAYFEHNDEDQLIIQFPGPVAADSVILLQIDYEGLPEKDGFGAYVQTIQFDKPAIYTLSQPYGAKNWWPCTQDLLDKIDSLDIEIAVPVQFAAAANGLLVSIKEDSSGWHTYHWKHRYPIATYLVAFAVGDYELMIDSVRLSTGVLPIMNFIWPEATPALKNDRLQTIELLQWYDTLLGPYPFHLEKYGHVLTGFQGGMEHQTMSFMANFNLELVAHELVHHYFGNMITCASWQDIWINEGFATFLSAYYYKFTQGGIWWPRFLEIRRRQVFSGDSGSVFVKDTSTVPNVFNSRLVYGKGGLILLQLKNIMGERPFFNALRNILKDSTLMHGFVTAQDIFRHFSQEAGQSLDWYFDQWYYGEGHARLITKLSYESNVVHFEVKQQPTHPSVKAYHLPLHYKLYLKDRDTSVVFWIRDTHTHHSFFLKDAWQLDSVVFDPDMEILAEQQALSIEPDERFLSKSGLILFPNPARDITVLEIYPMSIQGRAIRVYNMAGSLVLERNETSPSIEINTAMWPPGMYTVAVDDGFKINTIFLLIR